MTTMDGSTEARIVELEIRSAHQQEMVEQLNDVVVSQQREIDDLARRLRELSLLVTLSAVAVGGEGPQDV